MPEWFTVRDCPCWSAWERAIFFPLTASRRLISCKHLFPLLLSSKKQYRKPCQMSGFYSLLWKPRNSGYVEWSGGSQSQSQKHPLRLLAGRCCRASACLLRQSQTGSQVDQKSRDKRIFHEGTDRVYRNLSSYMGRMIQSEFCWEVWSTEHLKCKLDEWSSVLLLEGLPMSRLWSECRKVWILSLWNIVALKHRRGEKNSKGFFFFSFLNKWKQEQSLEDHFRIQAPNFSLNHS